ncbi:FUSC family protein [Providencia burhodogranariea]|uniref:Multidrug resistance protein n=1 Tax=Providencia burhodogranariea DSM 19968 TaxID=1141662 RepID=K8WLC1_9GAMM|nr:multidrug resistance protein [Providencia burhodogranariea DSM 19968]
MMTAKASLVIKQIQQDLLPFKFRMATTWRIALLCALMAGIAMLYEIPESAISCYLIIYLVKTNAVENILISVGVIILCSLAVFIVFVLFNLTIQNVVLRFFLMALFSGLFMYLSSASSLGDVGNLVALVIAFLMTLIDDVPLADVATRGLLYALLMAVSPMLLVIIFNYFFGISPKKLLMNKLSERLMTANQFFLGKKVSQLEISEVLSTQTECKRYLMMMKLLYLRGKQEILMLENMVDNSYEVLIMSLTLPEDTPTSVRLALSEKCKCVAEYFSSNDLKNIQTLVEHQPVKSGSNKFIDDFEQLLFKQKIIVPIKKKNPFFVDDAFTNPNHKYFAIKTTCAAILCYLFYDYFEWQGIHTAMITCYVVALTSVGETVHKLTLRIIGCLIGALIGIISLVYIIPNLSDIFQLMVLIFFCMLPAAWVAVGNDRISYAGVQVGLAFLLTVLQGFKPSFELDVASDRILGILLGNIVMYIIFTKVWPVSIMNTIYKQLKSILDNFADLKFSSNKTETEALDLVSSINEGITKSKDDINLLMFEKMNPVQQKELILSFKKIMNEMSSDSYQGYAQKFMPFPVAGGSFIDLNNLSENDFKQNILNTVLATLPAQEKELVIRKLISEK